MLWKIRRKTWANKMVAKKAEKVSEYTRRKMSLAIVDVAWSNILCRDVSDDERKLLESPPKKQKVLETGPEGEPFTFLATAQRDGSVILWEMKTPVTNESDVSIATEIETDYHWPTALCWLHHNQGKVHSKDFLAIGSLTGELGLWQIMYKEHQTAAAVRVCDLWTEKDDMRIDYICWIPCETDPSYWYLLTMKAQHIILFLLSIPTLEEELASPVVLSSCVQNSLHTVPSSGLYSCPSFAISCSQDGSLQKVQPCYANNELSVKVDLFEKHPPIGPAHRGCTMTASGVYLSTLT
ncbi:hypothetical protein HOLleu_34238 [Holothuria leucospilota]|uniref:Transcription factor IIIC 90kDa subunit N-terminal domain-containing protein n=1 Tax=Holothuria leucospilota TaxID=206669 RepID=A0A9Q0YPH3_HOLLE|nr:hypothetical protein HOLleu_34238 [Holothuria leucospilota]